MSTRLKIMTGVALFHLMLVTFGVLKWKPVSYQTRPGAVVASYGSASGSDNHYGFFAPSVGSAMRVRFQITDRQGRVRTETLEDLEKTKEVALRIGTLVSQTKTENKKLRRVLMASLAAHQFRRHPDAIEINVKIEAIHIPTMEAHRNGEDFEWVPAWEARFRRGENQS